MESKPLAWYFGTMSFDIQSINRQLEKYFLNDPKYVDTRISGDWYPILIFQCVTNNVFQCHLINIID